MEIKARKIINSGFTGLGFMSLAIMAAVVLVILIPISYQGLKAYLFTGTVEYRKFQLEKFERGDSDILAQDLAAVTKARQPMYDYIAAFEKNKRQWDKKKKRAYRSELKEIKKAIAELVGPAPGQKTPVLLRQQFGQTRMDRAEVKQHHILYREEWRENPTDPTAAMTQVMVPRVELFKGTELEPLFAYVENNLDAMMQPKFEFYWQFLIDRSYDSHFFGGIGAEFFGTLLLTLGAIVFAIPLGVIAAIYLCEYAKPSRIITLIRSCISTLAGVPSIVFGLFGLAFFLNTLKITETKSIVVGSMTLALMILPTIIRASEEAILAVPATYKEASLGLGAGKWFTIRKEMIPAAMPGILTGVVISMGRAAGETAPIIFTAAVSLGSKLPFSEALVNPTPALPWNIYNLCSEHEAVDEIRHVQYGMVFTLIMLVVLLNLVAIIMRAKISAKSKKV